MSVVLLVHVDREDGRVAWTDVQCPESFEMFYRRWHKDVLSLCRKLLGDRGDVEATAQEAFLRAWMARDRYTPAKPVWPWLAMITRRLCLDHRRRLAREERPIAVLEPVADPAHPEEVAERNYQLLEVTRAIRSLRQAERRALVLREVQGWSYQEIACHEGVTVESVRGSLKRARAALRRSGCAVLEDEMLEPPLSASWQ